MTVPPVGSVCEHRSPAVTPMQHPSYREEGGWIYYHGYFLVKKAGSIKLEWCGKPEPWRWKQYLRYCGECDIEFSNPWVPVCKECWIADGMDSESYPSWDHVIRLDQERKMGNAANT